MRMNRRLIEYFDWPLFWGLFIICLLGLTSLYSAGFDPDSTGTKLGWLGVQIQSAAFLRQLLYLIGGYCVLLLALCIPSHWLYRLAYPFYAACLVLLVFVLVFGVVRNNARSWFHIGPLHFQPAEIMKLGLTLCMARYLARNPAPVGGYGLLQLWQPGLIILIPILLILKQPDFGTAMIVLGIGVSMILFLGIRLKIILYSVLLVMLAIPVVWQKLYPYQKSRVMVLFNPEADPKGAGYHIIQSKIAVGSGGLLGRGYLEGSQSHLAFLPEHTTDFIFSVWAEEWGFLGSMLLLGAYLFLLQRMLRVVAKGKDLFSSLVALGVSAQLFFHIFVNIGMVIGLLPVVGIPLPLLSYGGSSVLSTMFSLGIVLGLSMRRYALMQRI